MLAFSFETFWHKETISEMFVVGLPILEKMLRPVVVYFFLVISLRIFGKRELTNINPFDFVVLLTLSNTVQNAIIGNDNSVSGGIIGATTLLATNYLVVRFLFKHRRLDQIVEGKPTVLVENGKVCRDGLAREMLTEAELLSVAHRQGFSKIEEIEHCELEPGGTFFVKGKTPGTDEIRHVELLQLIGELTAAVEALKQEAKSRQ
jgi:uncharacterized membrane protein YcaP (DUF421 family)